MKVEKTTTFKIQPPDIWDTLSTHLIRPYPFELKSDIALKIPKL